jgi:hypothetical protein
MHLSSCLITFLGDSISLYCALGWETPLSRYDNIESARQSHPVVESPCRGDGSLPTACRELRILHHALAELRPGRECGQRRLWGHRRSLNLVVWMVVYRVIIEANRMVSMRSNLISKQFNVGL